jgi:toxin ParE1/3/4
MPRVDLTPAATEDLKEIWNHISQDSVFQADRLLGRFSLKFDYLAIHSGMGRPRPELAADCRSYPLGKYCFYYKAADDGILVLRVLHSARDIRQISFPP